VVVDATRSALLFILEKKIRILTLDNQHYDLDHLPEEVYEVNPYGSLPTLIDRDLALYQADIIMEYLDERFPHPPLLPVYPVERGKTRLMMYRIKHDWYGLAEKILQDGDDAAEAKSKMKTCSANCGFM
jgi:RNA polymerase-associated protein